jgi:manganese transport protein
MGSYRSRVLAPSEPGGAASSPIQRLKGLWPYLGPAFVASVAYIDPGNFATNVAGGSELGYRLLWVVLAANLMAILVQALSAKLGIATGRGLARVCRDELPRPVALSLWVVAEVVAMATDLAEVLGAAIGFRLLFGIGLLPAALLTGVFAFAVLYLHRWGHRPVEYVIMAMLAVVGICYAVEVVLVHPPAGPILHGMLVPFVRGRALYLAIGILGATVMPHVVFLHSDLTKSRIPATDEEHRKRLFRFEIVDVALAMNGAWLVNSAMLIMAAAVFWSHGVVVRSLEEAHRTLAPVAGPLSSLLFGISLLASGLSSSTVGTMAGQGIMEGFLGYRVPLFVRRAVTLVPALVVIAAGIDPLRILVLSQVMLSFGLPFAVIPLVWFTARSDLMGGLVNRRLTTLGAIAVVGVIVALNVALLVQTLG